MNFQQPNPLHLLVRHLRVHSAVSGEGEGAILALPYKLKTVEAQSYLLREGDRPDPPHAAQLTEEHDRRARPLRGDHLGVCFPPQSDR